VTPCSTRWETHSADYTHNYCRAIFPPTKNSDFVRCSLLHENKYGRCRDCVHETALGSPAPSGGGLSVGYIATPLIDTSRRCPVLQHNQQLPGDCERPSIDRYAADATSPCSTNVQSIGNLRVRQELGRYRRTMSSCPLSVTAIDSPSRTN